MRLSVSPRSAAISLSLFPAANRRKSNFSRGLTFGRTFIPLAVAGRAPYVCAGLRRHCRTPFLGRQVAEIKHALFEEFSLPQGGVPRMPSACCLGWAGTRRPARAGTAFCTCASRIVSVGTGGSRCHLCREGMFCMRRGETFP
jgi:hypothetical protein